MKRSADNVLKVEAPRLFDNFQQREAPHLRREREELEAQARREKVTRIKQHVGRFIPPFLLRFLKRVLGRSSES